jgi:hypothetical protein
MAKIVSLLEPFDTHPMDLPDSNYLANARRPWPCLVAGQNDHHVIPSKISDINGFNMRDAFEHIHLAGLRPCSVFGGSIYVLYHSFLFRV